MLPHASGTSHEGTLHHLSPFVPFSTCSQKRARKAFGSQFCKQGLAREEGISERTWRQRSSAHPRGHRSHRCPCWSRRGSSALGTKACGSDVTSTSPCLRASGWLVCRFLLRANPGGQLSPTQLLAHPLQQDGGENRKGKIKKTHGLKYREFNLDTREKRKETKQRCDAKSNPHR